jgi:hypothetical protein
MSQELVGQDFNVPIGKGDEAIHAINKFAKEHPELTILNVESLSDRHVFRVWFLKRKINEEILI